MKILQFIASSGWGGAEKQFVGLVNELARSASVTVLIHQDCVWRDRIDHGVQILTLARRSRWHPASYWSLLGMLRRGGYDVIHTHGAKASQLVFPLARLLRLCHVATKHNDRKGKIFNHIHHVTAVSRAVAKTVSHPATIIHNGLVPVPVEQRVHPQRPFRMLAVGRLDPIKGFAELIDQCAGLDFDYRLDIVGEGPLRDALQQRINGLGLQRRVALPGQSEAVPELMAQADLVVISSRAEGFSLVALEALFYAPLMLSTPVGICSEVLPPSLLVAQAQLGTAINRVVRDYAALQQQFAAAVATQRQHFLLGDVANEYMSYYRQVCVG